MILFVTFTLYSNIASTDSFNNIKIKTVKKIAAILSAILIIPTFSIAFFPNVFQFSTGVSALPNSGYRAASNSSKETHVTKTADGQEIFPEFISSGKHVSALQHEWGSNQPFVHKGKVLNASTIGIHFDNIKIADDADDETLPFEYFYVSNENGDYNTLTTYMGTDDSCKQKCSYEVEVQLSNGTYKGFNDNDWNMYWHESTVDGFNKVSLTIKEFSNIKVIFLQDDEYSDITINPRYGTISVCDKAIECTCHGHVIPETKFLLHGVYLS